MSELAPAWQVWAQRRPETQVVHLDHAAAGRTSLAVRHAVNAHLQREVEVGGYVAEAEARDVLDAGRSDLAALLGVRTDDLAFVQSASDALQALLTAWPLGDGASAGTVGIARGEWEPNRQAFTARGLRTVELAVDGDGRLDLDALSRTLVSNPPSVVHLTQLASHRALVQPVAEVAVLCRAAGVPLWVDAAQALGHLDTAVGADAVYAPGRKWLGGPRGVGVLAIAQRAWEHLRLERPVMPPGDVSIVRWLEPGEASVAGRVGLCVAAREYLVDGPPAVNARLVEVGEQTRSVLADLPGWEVADGAGATGAITALRASAGQDVTLTRARLLDEGILTSAALPWRAREMSGPLLRLSPHVDCTAAALERLRSALKD